MSDQEIEFQKRGIVISYQKMGMLLFCTVTTVVSIIWGVLRVEGAINKNDTTISNHTLILGSHDGQIKDLKEGQARQWTKISDLSDKIDEYKNDK